MNSHDNMGKNRLLTADFFAGVGGIRLGFEKNGFMTAYSNEYDENCAITYIKNFGNKELVVEDIRKLDPNSMPDFDVFLGGFPCQPFSVAGYRKGFKDTRNGNLFFEILKILGVKKPRAILLENVKNLKTHDRGKTFQIIKTELQKLGYHLNVAVLNTMTHGNIPQNRERVFIVGFLSEKELEKFYFPTPLPLTVKLEDILENDVEEKYYYNGKALYDKLKDNVRLRNTAYQWRRQYVRENKSGVCPTLTANMGMGGHNVPIVLNHKGIRKLTPRECFRLQGFPNSFKLPEIADSKLYKQAGNSVSVSVIERIAQNMKNAMSNAKVKPPIILRAHNRRR